MSNRPKAENSFLSRLRRPVGRLRDMPIWSKLGLIMIVPTIAIMAIGITRFADTSTNRTEAQRTVDLAALSEISGGLVDRLQDERAQAVLLVGADDQAKVDRYRNSYQDAQKRVDEARVDYAAARGALRDMPSSFGSLLDQVDQDLTDLPAARSQVTNSKFKLTEASRSYKNLIDGLLSLRDSASQFAADTALAERMRAAAAVSRAKENLSERRIVGHRVLIQKEMTPALRTEYIRTDTGHEQAVQTFQSVANRAESELYDQTVEGPDLRSADKYGAEFATLPTGSIASVTFNADQWDEAMVGHANLVRTVESSLDATVLDRAVQLRGNTDRQLLIETGVLLALLLLPVIFTYVVARSMARSLRDLKHVALSLAQYGLPQAVARLRDPQFAGGQMTPAQAATQIAEPLPIRGRDEFGQVTEAFNTVHTEAVRIAAEQAALRSSVSTMFVNLARRSQILVDRLIGHLDRLERGEEDPDRLSELFQLDHLATRMRRNDENLLVLAGADSTRVQREPAALTDVLRAAQSEVEHYTRIEFGVIDRDLEVAAHAVNDLVHLVAELFDNATAFSPPDSQVMVEARRVGDRASLYVEDHGIGITPEQLRELNDRLANPPMVDVAVSRMMGLVVVARLAARNGVKVELRAAADRGTVADVTLPTSVLVPRALSGRMPHAVGAGPAAAQPGFAPLGQQPGFAPLGQPGPTPAGQPSGFASLRQPGLDQPDLAPSGPGFAPLGQPAEEDGVRPGGGQRPPLGAPLALESGSSGHRPPGADESGPESSGAIRRHFDPLPPVNGGGAGGRTQPGRAMPAWSDLTGANGVSGLPTRPTNGRGGDPLPQRRAAVEGEITGGGPGPTIPRQVPHSPDLPPSTTQGPQRNEPPIVAPMAAPGAPAGAQRPTVPIQPNAPRRQPETPASQPEGRPHQPGSPLQRRPVSGPPQPATPSGTPISQPPPVWPPVNAPERETASPPAVPEKLAAALDMTAELPKVMRSPAERPQPAAVPQQRYADETMELPIFRELESAWFRTRKSTGDDSGSTALFSSPAVDAPTEQFVTVDARPGAAHDTSTRTTGGAGMVKTPDSQGHRPARSGPAPGGGAQPRTDTAGPASPPSQPGWQTAADDGWRAASAAAAQPVSEKTQMGLPKRVPMAQLVPGGVDKPATSVQRRTPEAVRGLLSAYHRGVQRGRTTPTDDQSTNPSDAPAGQKSSQSGLGPSAGGGQKEHEG